MKSKYNFTKELAFQKNGQVLNKTLYNFNSNTILFNNEINDHLSEFRFNIYKITVLKDDLSMQINIFLYFEMNSTIVFYMEKIT